jgi:DNA excision repair protein ERCC-4
MHILIDSREQNGYHFDRFQDVTTSRAALVSGDYSLAGAEHLVSLERKSIDDLVSCLCRERARFERELHRLRGYELRAVVVEADLLDLARGNYRSRMNPASCVNSVLALHQRFDVPFLFAGSRRAGEYCVYQLLRFWLKDAQERAGVVLAMADSGRVKVAGLAG